MIYILSLLGILIENSLPFGANIYIVTLSFFIYLVSVKQKSSLIFIGIISLLLSLQTDYFLRFFLIMLLSYYIVSYIFLNLSYRRLNIFLISLMQMVMYAALTVKNMKIDYLIINFIGCMILNYIYIKISDRNKTSEGSIV
ncbi:hypothetical protein [Fusobacterium sp.]|uniref:hypothetical protein n=1 Tax=Fusobacterium sp. TaxID=68766 RepID=UPI00396C67B1